MAAQDERRQFDISLIFQQMKEQDERHDKQIEGIAEQVKAIAAEVRENTSVSRKCFEEMIKFDVERQNWIQCIMDMRGKGEKLEQVIQSMHNSLIRLEGVKEKADLAATEVDRLKTKLVTIWLVFGAALSVFAVAVSYFK